MSDELPTRLQEEASLFTSIMVWVGLATFGIPPAIWVYQIYRWLRDGFWTSITIEGAMISGGFDIPYTDWRGVQRIIDWIVSFPLAIGILVLGVAVCALILPVYTRAQERANDERNGRSRPAKSEVRR